ncbi:hypothetical protein BXZ70DRAFT_917812 [Cristinia sonorae]|uniref:GST N-terminal domain-containing protein n=1 Tax=Cristinia sonorae TaxID=1940300 RepID=A0A8K0UW26_9AGAR|nr:hypothetical protein BXZ70DRAFT_917812 [Cristinia sonorae]
MNGLSVILYHYDASPFATKVKNMLLVKRIPHKRVTVPMTMPRPELSKLLGVTYRKIPVLAIGNDVYCDTSVIASALERRFPASAGYGSLFPYKTGSTDSNGSQSRDTGMAMALSMFWSDRVVFPLAASSLPYAKFPESFIKDRERWYGQSIDPKCAASKQPETTSAIASHLTLLEQQLSDGRQWIMDTTSPGLVDISAHVVFRWLGFFKSVREIFDINVFPQSIAWIKRMNEYFDKLQKDRVAPFEDISADDGARIICNTPEQPNLLRNSQVEALRLGLILGQTVSVSPSDNGKVPTTGKLLAIDSEEVVVEVLGSAGRVQCHFPRLNFSVQQAATAARAKL